MSTQPTHDDIAAPADQPGGEPTAQAANVPTELHRLPPRFQSVPYDPQRHPCAPGVVGLEGGANCQQYAYELLHHYGLEPPTVRSSELFTDEASSRHVSEPAPLDLLLLNRTDEPYGAHVAVYLGQDRAVHLSLEVGRPVVWPLEEFFRHERYRTLVGIKRITRRSCPLHLEPAAVEDVDRLVELRDGAARWLLDRGIQQWLPDEFTAERMRSWVEAGVVHVLREQHLLAGSVAVLWDDPDIWGLTDTPAGYIHLLIVRNERRGRGLGDQLLAWAEQHIRRSGRAVARLDAVSSNQTLHRWYDQRGYIEVGRHTFTDSRWFPVTLREKQL